MSGVFDDQLGGPADRAEQDGESAPLDVVVRDATEEPLEGAYSICYVNGFQTQPEDAEFWHDHPDLLLWEGDEAATDPGWPDELILDPSTPDQRTGSWASTSPSRR
ncbi:MAG TPA: endo alpha-1,4 polygalactosaminidase, partial [Candidatus Nesterenkonia stercoripullorum]|nr:endo alpha-1,4 polygalactosaminidase [Candidatus Nesterenkonia stercoripullorum]